LHAFAYLHPANVTAPGTAAAKTEIRDYWGTVVCCLRRWLRRTVLMTLRVRHQ